MVTLVQVPRYIGLLKNYASKPTLTKWHVKDGDLVDEGQPLVVVETSKTSLEIEAMVSGILFIMKKAGDKVLIGETLGMITKSRAELKEFRAQLLNYQIN